MWIVFCCIDWKNVVKHFLLNIQFFSGSFFEGESGFLESFSGIPYKKRKAFEKRKIEGRR